MRVCGVISKMVFKMMIMYAFSVVLCTMDTVSDFALAEKYYRCGVFIFFTATRFFICLCCSMSRNDSSFDQPFQELGTQLIGDLTFLMPFLPTCLTLLGGIWITATMMVKRNQTRRLQDVVINLLRTYFLVPLAFLPYVQIAVNIIGSLWVTGSLVKDLFDHDLIFSDQEEIEDDQLSENFLLADNAKTYMNLGKTAETVGESAPQFILQLAILLIASENPLFAWDYLMDDFQKAGFWSSMLVVLTTS